MCGPKCFVYCGILGKGQLATSLLSRIALLSVVACELMSLLQDSLGFIGSDCFKWAINRVKDFIEPLSSLWQVLMAVTESQLEGVNCEQHGFHLGLGGRMKQRSRNSAGVPTCITGLTVNPVPWWTLAGAGWRRRLMEGKVGDGTLRSPLSSFHSTCIWAVMPVFLQFLLHYLEVQLWETQKMEAGEEQKRH